MSLLTRALVLVCLCIAAAANLHCSRDADDARSTAEKATAPVLGAVPEFTLTSEAGEPYGSDQLRGKAWIATVIATSTGAAQQTGVMSTLQRELSGYAVWDAVRIVTLTVKPEEDTPAVLTGFARRVGADSTNWRFLTGSRSALTDVIRGLGLPVEDETQAADGPITSSTQFVLVDRRHNVRGVYNVSTIEHLLDVVDDLRYILPEAPELDDGSGRTHLAVPPDNLNLNWLEERRQDQISRSASAGVFNEFQFVDRLPESGITFRNKVLDNAGKDWIPNHYDHGNGVAIADVDGDGKLDLYFTSQVGGNELWRNLGGGRFENVTAQAGIGLADRVNVTASFADYDNDGDADLFVTSVRGGNTLFENDGAGSFTNVTEQAGVRYAGHSSAAVFFDYNQDGLLDLLVVNVGKYTSDSLRSVTNGTSREQSDEEFTFYDGYEDAFDSHLDARRSESNVFYENLGDGRFADATERVGLVHDGWSGDATPMNGNGDEWPDLYVLNMQGDDAYYENVGGERFVDKTAELFRNTPWGAMGVKAFDYNNDGELDLYLTDMHSDMSESVGPEHEKDKSDMQWPEDVLATGGTSIFGNALYERDGSDFREVSDEVGAENYWPWGLSVGDLNADGYTDVFIASGMNYPFRYGVNSVLLNDRGRGFIDSEFALGVEPRRDGRLLTPWYELWCEDADRGHEYCEGRTGDVVVWGALGSRSSAVFDLDDDGDLDIVTNDFNSEPMVLISNLADRKEDLNFLKVRLVGTTSNRDGLGATVTVTAGGSDFVQVLDGVTGYLSHGVYPLYFGLGDAAEIDQVEVRWPTGETQEVSGPITRNQILTLTEE